MIRLFDTARSQVVPLALRDPGKVSIYVCGPTVYAPPHLGHGRMALVYDVLRRYLEWSGLSVTFVSNITDIDDNIINRANEQGRDPAELAVRCEAIWWQGMERIDVRRPDHTPRATEYVSEMVDLIGSLLERGVAYRTGDGVYLAVEEVPGYGLLARQSLDDLRQGGGERELVGSEKRHPADFALWKLAKPGEPSWPSPWGDGRPGWHTECVVMSLGLLGDGFDLHTGGLDLAFPHHENERAQAVALGREFARHWMHNGFVELGGEKMSKSLGNITNLLDLTDTYDGRAYRLLVLQAHYRSPIEVTATTLDNAANALRGLHAFTRRTAALASADPPGEVVDAFRSAMDDDLDTPRATALMFRQVNEANAALDADDTARAAAAASGARLIAAALGLDLTAPDEEVPAEVAALVERRQAARAARDFGEADAIRDQLTEEGWVIEDGPQGPEVRRA